ncbi:hypothetical protein [Streptomyces sp. NPDC088350]|uniref:DUF7848 domain-containing protein n=1 Tax=Streptomyces sp. NPDC088350 TaxID=3365854 RepID=UPI00380D3AC0
MSSRRTYRFRNYNIRADSDSPKLYSAACVTDKGAPCDAHKETIEPEAIERWIAEHVRDTGHEHFRRTFSELVTATPEEWQ